MGNNLRGVLRAHSVKKGKTVLLRIDTDVDFVGGKILDDTRLTACDKTLSYLLKKGADVILLGHLGRPTESQKSKVKSQKYAEEFSLEPVAKWFAKHYKGIVEKRMIGEFEGWEITPHLHLLENLRFFSGEEANDKEFSRSLSILGDFYVNDAFAVSHRSHASIVGIAELLPSYAGFHLEKEIETLGNILKDPKRPLTVLIGGAKIETKLPLVEKMHRIADYVLVGGEIAEQDAMLIKVQHEKINPPAGGKKSAVLVADNISSGLDITDKDAENFIQILDISKTIVWNGPVGKMGVTETERNTLRIAKAVASSKAYTVVGGGDTLALLTEHNLLNKFSFVSTGGGAMLEFLSGKELPGIEALKK